MPPLYQEGLKGTYCWGHSRPKWQLCGACSPLSGGAPCPVDRKATDSGLRRECPMSPPCSPATGGGESWHLPRAVAKEMSPPPAQDWDAACQTHRLSSCERDLCVIVTRPCSHPLRCGWRPCSLPLRVSQGSGSVLTIADETL